MNQVIEQRRERQRLIHRGRHMHREIQQIFDDCSHWNRINARQEPVDPDPDGELGRCLQQLDWVRAADHGCVCPLGVTGDLPSQVDTCRAEVHWFNETRLALP